MLKSAVWLTGFAVIYLLFLRNERYFNLKRIYLVCGIIVSFVFPLITIRYQVELPAPAAYTAETVTRLPQEGSPGQQAYGGREFNYSYFIAGFYLAGLIFIAFRMGLHFLGLYKSIRKSKINHLGPAKLVRASEYPSSFSFFNYYFCFLFFSDFLCFIY